MPEFVHLHTHSHYSLLDGLPKVNELVNHVKKQGFKSVALTDYGALYGAIEFYKTARKAGIKPIIGFEAFVASGSRLNHAPKPSEPDSHIILLAENYEGYKNLMILSSRGALEGFTDKPRIDKELLREYHNGVIVLSGCLDGEIAQLITQGAMDRARAAVEEYKAICGADHFYLELQDHPERAGQVEANNALIELGRATDTPLVVTRDVHYLEKEDAVAQDILTCIKTGRTVDDSTRTRMTHIDRSLNSAKDICSRFRHVEDALENTVKIAERCNVEIPLGKWYFPPIPIPEGTTSAGVLRENTEAGLKELAGEITPAMQERLDYELNIISTKGYDPYFLAVADYTKWARAHGIIATTRGSAAGSLVSYAIGITTVNPLDFKLPFERFLNPFRPSPPDIDMDFADNQRDEVIEYVTEKYGADKVAQIITFGTMAARGSVRDVGRALGFSYSFCDQVSKAIPFGSQGFPMTIHKALQTTPELYALYNQNADVKRLLDLAQKIEGNARHTSVHAAGVVIAPTALTDFTPVQREVGGTRVTTQYDMHEVEDAGLLKMDFLGIRNLSILGNAVKIVQKTRGLFVDLQRIPWDDAETYAMLSEGKTAGLFQLGGTGMTRYLMDLKPSNLFDIMAMVALFRPGPMESIPEFIRRKQDSKLITYLDPRMKEYLDMSYGVITYQDDVLLTAINIAGYSWEEADKLRKAMGKKIPEEMAAQKEKFIDGCIGKGLNSEKAHALWKLIEPFAAYGFNKCVTGDTRVQLESGEWCTINTLYKRASQTKLTGTTEREVGYVKVKRIVSEGVCAVYRVHLRSGRVLKATANHPLKTFNGWTDIQHLRKGSRVAVARRTPAPHRSRRVPVYKLVALGYLLSEGNLCHPHGIYFYSANNLEIQAFCQAACKFGNTRLTIDRSKSAASVYVGKRNQKKKNGLRFWLDECGLLGKKATGKFFPPVVFSLSNKSLSVLLGALWQGDGCVSLTQGGQIFYATSSERLAYELQHLLSRFGIISIVHAKRFAYRDGYKKGFTVHISSSENIKLFSQTIGRNLIGEKRHVMRALLRNHPVLNRTLKGLLARGTSDTIPIEALPVIQAEARKRYSSLEEACIACGFAARLISKDKKKKGFRRETIMRLARCLKSDKLLAMVKAPYFWDEITAIHKIKDAEVFDLNVPVVENFLANDVVVHNSHAASYAVVAYQTAYMKAHFPEEYMAAVLSAESGDIETVAQMVDECKHLGIDVLPPDVNESFELFAVVPQEISKGNSGLHPIRFGLGAIKNVGDHIAHVIIEERKARGAFESLEDFLRRIQDKDLNKKSLESLIKCGAMDRFGERGFLLNNIDALCAFNKAIQREVDSNQTSLFGGSDKGGGRLMLKPYPAALKADRLAWEKELIGLYVSEHPFADWSKRIGSSALRVAEINKAGAEMVNEWVVVCGMVMIAKKIITKKGSAMLFVQLQDVTGSIEIVVFPKTYERYKEYLVEGAYVCVIGRHSEKENEKKILAERIEALNENTWPQVQQTLKMAVMGKGREQMDARSRSAEIPAALDEEMNAFAGAETSGADASPQEPQPPVVVITVPPQATRTKIDALKKMLARVPGMCAVHLAWQKDGKTQRFVTSYKIVYTKNLHRQIEALMGAGSVGLE